uniref:Pullulanase 1, chloroplastic n=1 Tax=Triticum urartu TaxID=4572 RepID=A0A8R7QVS7_TRIUA
MPMPMRTMLLRHLSPAPALPNPRRSSASSPQRRPARARPPPLHSARATALRARRTPMAAGETGASVSVSAAEAEAEATQAFMPDARAYWVTSDLIAWNVSEQEAASVYLYASRTAAMGLSPSNGGIQGYDSKVELQPESAGLPETVTQKFPFISSYRAFRVPSSVDVASLVKCQLVVASFGADGKHVDVTGLQLPGVLDDIFAYTGPLGAVFREDSVSLHLWAPTAQDVSVCFFDGPAGPVLETVQLKESNGVWSVTGPREWENRYYLYEVDVYHPTKAQVLKCLAGDPYARGLSANGARTWLVDINNETLKPASWDELADEKPKLDSFSDITIYELHIRDFSAHDGTVDSDSRGGFRAFAYQASAGMQHLRKLSDAGLTHVHLLPSFHFAGVDDIKSNWKFVDECKLATFPPGSDMQQAAVVAIQEEDPYNWGYNPVLWGVPKGSYASDPDGPSRIIEYRQMVQALNRIGLRVVMDVVYNHLDSSGPCGISSVLDKIVPGYYVRRDTNGQIENSAAMNNTASEHFMVDRLIVDDLLNWAVNYKVSWLW